MAGGLPALWRGSDGVIDAVDATDGPLWTSTKSKSPAENAQSHWRDHGSDFPNLNNALEYAASAHSFLKDPPTGTLTVVRSNGDIVRYHPDSELFGVMTGDVVPKTFFVPDPNVHTFDSNLEYFFAQEW